MEKEEIQRRVEEGMARKKSGKYNCAQAVTSVYCDVAGLDEELAMRLAGAYGTGMGCLEGTCGALVGAGMILGMASANRVEAMQRMRMVMEAFRQRNGATICRELKGVGTGVELRPCTLCVADACEMLGKALGFRC